MEAPAWDRSPLSRALYSSDASLYRVVPDAVAVPHDLDELNRDVEAALAAGMPITMRGAGTSVAGNAIGPGLIIDTRRLNRIASIDPEQRSATVQPGVVAADLTAAAAPLGLRFGPDPSTTTRCTIGGMIGNNACGPRALGYGRTSDQVLGLDVVTGRGERIELAPGADPRRHRSATLTSLRELVQANLGVIRTEFGRFPRQVSGYALEHLLPEHSFDVARFLVGSEGTLGVVTEATVRLTREPRHRNLVLMGYPALADAADAVAAVLPTSATACEGLDARIVQPVLGRVGRGRLPPGSGWLFVEFSGDDPAELADQAAELVRRAAPSGSVIVTAAEEVASWWRLRGDAAGYAGAALAGPAHPGWEDAAVPPEQLGSYLREFDALLSTHGLRGLPYGHFAQGCVHCRIDYPLDSSGGPARLRAFVEEAADLVAHYRGSLSGEHGDGRARSALLPRMYSPAAMDLFANVKRLFDPDNLLNPGVLVEPAPIEADLRLTQLSHPLDSYASAAHSCTGIGRCVAPGANDAMCPSFQVTGAEKDSTRGRARVLQELVNGRLVGTPRSPAVTDALDLCLACKACATECPAGVDLAGLKSLTLERAHYKRLRPRTHYTLGMLPRWTALLTRLPGLARLVNAVLSSPMRAGLLRLAGIDPRRRMPKLRAHALVDALPGSRGAPGGERAVAESAGSPLGPVAIWADSFSRGFAGRQLEATVAVLVAAGYEPELIQPAACCGLTWITTGQRDAARERLAHSLEVLAPWVDRGVPIVGVEPSCLAVWRDEAAELLTDARLGKVAAGLFTLAELLASTPDYRPPDLSGRRVVAQPHCHQQAVLGWAADAELLRRCGAEVTTLTGCCGLAGNFGMEHGHYDTSVAVAGLHLLPALADADDGTVVLADGFSCRLQIADLTGRRAVGLAELLADPPD